MQGLYMLTFLLLCFSFFFSCTAHAPTATVSSLRPSALLLSAHVLPVVPNIPSRIRTTSSAVVSVCTRTRAASCRQAASTSCFLLPRCPPQLMAAWRPRGPTWPSSSSLKLTPGGDSPEWPQTAAHNCLPNIHQIPTTAVTRLYISGTRYVRTFYFSPDFAVNLKLLLKLFYFKTVAVLLERWFSS